VVWGSSFVFEKKIVSFIKLKKKNVRCQKHTFMTKSLFLHFHMLGDNEMEGFQIPATRIHTPFPIIILFIIETEITRNVTHKKNLIPPRKSWKIRRVNHLERIYDRFITLFLSAPCSRIRERGEGKARLGSRRFFFIWSIKFNTWMGSTKESQVDYLIIMYGEALWSVYFPYPHSIWAAWWDLKSITFWSTIWK
jgi:hypothetical protein